MPPLFIKSAPIPQGESPLTQRARRYPIWMAVFWPPILMFYGLVIGLALPKMTWADLPLQIGVGLMTMLCFYMDLRCYRAALSEKGA